MIFSSFYVTLFDIVSSNVAKQQEKNFTKHGFDDLLKGEEEKERKIFRNMWNLIRWCYITDLP